MNYDSVEKSLFMLFNKNSVENEGFSGRGGARKEL
jgi:hypothetical protein